MSKLQIRKRGNSRTLPPVQVEYIRDVFEIEDIEKVWQVLNQKFHFNIKDWKAEFETESYIIPRFKTKQELFMEFGKKKIEPLLNVILKRHRYPTWINLLTYVLSEKIENRKLQQKLYKDLSPKY